MPFHSMMPQAQQRAPPLHLAKKLYMRCIIVSLFRSGWRSSCCVSDSNSACLCTPQSQYGRTIHCVASVSPKRTLAMQRHIIAGFCYTMNETQAQDAGKEGKSSALSQPLLPD